MRTKAIFAHSSLSDDYSTQLHRRFMSLLPGAKLSALVIQQIYLPDIFLTDTEIASRMAHADAPVAPPLPGKPEPPRQIPANLPDRIVRSYIEGRRLDSRGLGFEIVALLVNEGYAKAIDRGGYRRFITALKNQSPLFELWAVRDGLLAKMSLPPGC